MAERNEPIISFRDFSFQYRAQKRPTLTGIDLDIYPGSVCSSQARPAAAKHAGGLHQRPEPLFEPRRVHRHPDRGRRGCAAQQHL